MPLGFILNYIFAWLAVLLGVVLLSKYLLRKYTQKSQGETRHRLAQINKAWKWPHIILGFILVVIALVHGLNSSEDVLSLNFGTLNWLVTVLFGLTWIFKGYLHKKWMKMHQFLALFFMLTLVVHIVDGGGINVLRILAEMNDESVYEAVLIDEPKTNPENDLVDNPEKKSEEIGPEAAETELPYYFSFDGLELADGTYMVEDVGYSPGLKLEVTVKNNMVTGIKILSHNELDAKYYKEAMQKIPADILAQQSLDVDMITGSSMTSMGIIRAVRKAVLESMAEEGKP